MLVLGAGVLPSTFKDPKSVCVSSEDAGPRSWDLGLGENLKGVVVENCRGLMEWSAREGFRRRVRW